MNDIAKAFFDLLVDYYDDSALQPPIEVDDELHSAICNYRKSLPSGRLPPGEAEFMRQLLVNSRSDDDTKQLESQSVAEMWAKTLAEKYSGICDDEFIASDLGISTPRMPDDLTQGQQDIVDVVREHGRRMKMNEIKIKLEQKKLGQSPSTLKGNLAKLSRYKKVLPNRSDTNPRGYGFPEWK